MVLPQSLVCVASLLSPPQLVEKRGANGIILAAGGLWILEKTSDRIDEEGRSSWVARVVNRIQNKSA